LNFLIKNYHKHDYSLYILESVEITSDVADSKQSIILDQVENGVAVRMAVLYLLAGQM